MSIAFYAPLKSPNHPVPSGDRRVARLLMEALSLTGEEVELVSELRSYNRDGNELSQGEIQAKADKEIERLKQEFETNGPPKLWFSYHLYHKAPDLLGPVIAQHFNIPYYIAEASYAPKQQSGAWDTGLKASEKALKLARLIFSLNPEDDICINALLEQDKTVVPLAPFLDPTPYQHNDGPKFYWSQTLNIDKKSKWAITIGMMRLGDKTKSYEILAKSWRKMGANACPLIIVGGGENESEVKSFFDDMEAPVRFTGVLPEREVAELLNCCEISVWPGINEAFGLGLMESQAAGLPVISANRPGIANIVDSLVTGLLVEEGNIDHFAETTINLLNDDTMREKMSHAAREKILTQHSIAKAAETLKQSLGL